MIVNFIRRNRRKLLGTSLALSVPALLLAGLFAVSQSNEKMDAMRVAAIALNDYYADNPPYGVWDFQGVRITDDERLMVDVHVAVTPHATFIETRNMRIRYSYLKLACPKAKANVHQWLKNQTVWINLHFHGKTLMEGACPRGKGGFFTS